MIEGVIQQTVTRKKALLPTILLVANAEDLMRIHLVWLSRARALLIGQWIFYDMRTVDGHILLDG